MVEQLLNRVEQAGDELAELERALGHPQAPERADYADLTRRYAHLREVVEAGEKLRSVLEVVAEEEEMLEAEEDEALRTQLEEALDKDRQAAHELAATLRRLLVPQRPEDRRNAIVEIRGGAGGEESALFAADLFRMYTRYAERQGWQVTVMDSHPTPLGGYKQIVFVLEGEQAYGRLRYESGVHRVQRVPTTESGGRIHTSTATVAVLPEAEAVEVHLNPEELRVETYRAGGPGGQHMQKNETAVRITHLPTGLVVACQDERSQYRNREQALRLLRAKLRDLEEQKQAREVREARRQQVGSGDRSEKIRTYNFPQSRVTDHRIGFTVHRLEEVLDGDLDLVIDPLMEAEVQRALQG
ncbi:MAG: peptide chain release factor 1 [Candidatus Bipolaricaulaceae bacterium]